MNAKERQEVVKILRCYAYLVGTRKYDPEKLEQLQDSLLADALLYEKGK